MISASRSGAAIGSQQTLTITDDDEPVLVFSVDETSIAENGGTATITVSTGTGSTFATDQTITLTLAGTATENDDYTLSPGTLTLPAGSGAEASSVTATVTAVDDILREGDETLLISASRSGVAIGSQQTLTITDDDGPPVLVFSVDETSIAENGGTATITVSTGTGSTFATDQTITLTLAGTATENDDYTLSPGTLTLPAGSGAEASSVTATVTGVDDIFREGDETILISASRSGGAIGSQQTLTIIDDDGPPVLVFSVDETSIAENGGTATITVSTGTGSTFATDQTITFTLAGTATENEDYTISPGTLTLPAGSGAEASSVTATVTGVDDIFREGDETILISASRSGGAIGSQQTLTITDDDGPPVLVFSVDETSIAENGGTATITVSTGTGSTFATDQTITLTLAGTATENDDYTLSPDTLTLPAGSGAEASSVTATVTGVDDILQEGDETILISASRSGAAIGSQQTLTITDDDEPVLVFSVDETSIAENGGTATITVSTGTGSTFATDQTITLTLAGTATENDDYTLSPGTLTLPAGSGAEASSVTATVTGVDDILQEGDETLLISASRSGVAIGSQQTLTITDDDGPPVLVFSVDETSIAENGGTATITVSTGTGSTFATDQTITLTLAGTATENDDYTLSPDTLTLPAGSGAEASSVTATVTGVDDILQEGDEAILISASRSGVAIGAQQTLTITDDDEPVLVFSVDETSIAENGGTATITVSTGTGSTFATDQTITLTLAGTATENDDYTLSPDTLTLPAGSGAEASSVTATVTGVDDLIHEGDEAILISASRSGVTFGSQHTLTITDDDDEPPALVFSVDEASIAEDGGTATIMISTGTGSTFATDQTIALTLAGTATENDDYTLSSDTLTLPAGSGTEASSVTATVTGVDDILQEGDEAILISASRSGVAIGAQQTLTITDDDEPVLVFSVDETSIAEDGGMATITVGTGTGPTFATDQTIALTLAGTATVNDDYTLSSDTLTLPAGSGAEASSVTATVTGVDDLIHEGDEAILISASRSGVTFGSQHTLTITDDDDEPPALVFSVDEASIAEDGGTATIMISTGTGSTFATDQTIALTLAGAATVNDDYTLSSDTLTLPAGSGAEASSVTAKVTGVDDLIHEGNEAILISASRSGVTFGSQHTLTIIDDDEPPALVFSVDEASIAEDGGTATIMISTGTGSTFATDQTIALTLAGTATENDDYTLSSDTLTLPAGSGTEASSVTATVTGVDDILQEGDEAILISASRSGVAIGAQQTLTITDDDEPMLVFSVDETLIAEDGGTATIMISTGTGSTFATDQTIALTLAGAATENDDYTLSSDTLTLPAGSGTEASSVTAKVTGVDDILQEGDEAILISASRSGVAIGAQHTLTIIDDDEPPPPEPAVVTLVLTPDRIDENRGASTVTATVSPASEEAFRVTVSAVADAPAVAGDFELSGTVLRFAANATQSTGQVTVTAFDNNVDAPNKTVTVSGTVSQAGVVEPSNVTLTIIDDDEPPPPEPAVVTLVLTPDRIDENRGASTVTATVSPASEEAFRVTVSAVADAPAVAGDFELSGTVLRFAANATQSTGQVTVTAFDNNVDAPNKTVTVSGTVSQAGVVEPSNVTLTIIDDDEPPPPEPAVVTLVLTPDRIDENRGASTVTATVSPASEEAFRVTVSAVANAPAIAGDFELSGTVLRFAANATQSTGQVTVTAFDNNVDAPNKTVTVSGAVSQAGVVDPSHVTLTIIDDDDDEPPPPEPAVVTLVLTPDTIGENGGVSTVTANVSPASEEAFRVTVSAVADAPAVAGDFELSGTVLSFAANATQSTGQVTVTAFDNNVDAPNKTVTVSGTVSQAGVVEPSNVTLTIIDDDEPPPPEPAVVTLVLTPDRIDENRGASTVTATVSPASEEAFRVTVSAVANAPAIAGDFELSGTVLSFAANATDSTGEVTVTAFDNDQDAPDKTVTVSGTVSLTGVVEPSHVTLTITDDDEPPPPVPAVVTLVLTPDTIAENRGASAVTATVSPASEEAFRVTVSAVADAPAAAGDFELSGTVLSFAANATDSTGEVTVTAFDNDQDAPDKTVTVSGTVSLTGVVEPITRHAHHHR